MDLKNYIKDKLVFEGKLDTDIQEQISCVYFDQYFNIGGNFKQLIDTNQYEEAFNYLLVSDLLESFKKDIHLISDDWKKSFIYQTLTLKDFYLSEGVDSTSYSYIQHNTGNGIYCGKWFNIKNKSFLKRIDNGLKKFKISLKDNYQKADIYILKHSYNIDVNPLETIDAEINFWISQWDEYQNFIGVSLKKLKRQSIVTKYSFDKPEDKEYKIDEIEVVFKPTEKGKGNIASVSNAKINFLLTNKNHTQRKSFSFRSASSDNKPTVVAELTTINTKNIKTDIDGQEGKATQAFNQAISQRYNEKISKIDTMLSPEEINEYYNKLYSIIEKYTDRGVIFNIDSLPLIKKGTELYELCNSYAGTKFSSLTNKNSDAIKLAKWECVIMQQINMLYYIEKLVADNAKENNRSIFEEFKDFLYAMYCASKGDNAYKGVNNQPDFTHSPYIILGH